MTLAPFSRKLLLLLHVTTSVGLLGAVAAFLVLAIAGLATADDNLATAAYLSMRILTFDLVVPLAAATLLIGLVQSIGTPWGLVRYYWIIVKLVLTGLAVAVLAMQLETVDLLAAAARTGMLESYWGGRFSMVLHGGGGLTVLVIATALSVYKPRGITAYGARAIAAGR
jgi:hypothetical protein